MARNGFVRLLDMKDPPQITDQDFAGWMGEFL